METKGPSRHCLLDLVVVGKLKHGKDGFVYSLNGSGQFALGDEDGV